jgi:hypothetical protein
MYWHSPCFLNFKDKLRLKKMISTVVANSAVANSANQNSLHQALPCPNCGSPAERHLILDRNLTRTQCATCDYLLIACQTTGRVIESYAPGIEAIVLQRRQRAAR